MSTYRERREARADRLEGWADKRSERGQATLDRAREQASQIPFGQPMLTDHYSFKSDRNRRDRISAGYDRGFADLAKADGMATRAAGIRAAAEHAIYSDDTDAIERLRERIAGLEAERARLRAFNASCRAVVGGDPSLLDDRQRADLASVARHCPYQLGKRGEMPGYALSNLGGNIRKQQQRLAVLEAKAAQS